jgi:hypothetical protein
MYNSSGGRVEFPERRIWPDDARRIADEMTLHTIAGNTGRWCAFRLADGKPVARHACFDTRIDAVKACKWDRDNYVYLEVQPDGMTPRAAFEFLDYARQLHNAGFRLPDPEFDYAASMPTLMSDRVKQINHLARKTPIR